MKFIKALLIICVAFFIVVSFMIFYVGCEDSIYSHESILEGLTINEHNGLMNAMNIISEKDPKYEIFNTFDIDISGYYNSKYKDAGTSFPNHSKFLGSTSKKYLAEYEKAVVDMDYTSDISFNSISHENGMSDLGKFFKKVQYLSANEPVDSTFTLAVGSTIKINNELQLQITKDLREQVALLIKKTAFISSIIDINNWNSPFHKYIASLIQASDNINSQVNKEVLSIRELFIPINTMLRKLKGLKIYSSGDSNVLQSVNGLNGIITYISNKTKKIFTSRDIIKARILDIQTQIANIALNYNDDEMPKSENKVDTISESIRNEDNHLTQMNHQYELNEINAKVDKLYDKIIESYKNAQTMSINVTKTSLNNITAVINSAKSSISSRNKTFSSIMSTADALYKASIADELKASNNNNNNKPNVNRYNNSLLQKTNAFFAKFDSKHFKGFR